MALPPDELGHPAMALLRQWGVERRSLLGGKQSSADNPLNAELMFRRLRRDFKPKSAYRDPLFLKLVSGTNERDRRSRVRAGALPGDAVAIGDEVNGD